MLEECCWNKQKGVHLQLLIQIDVSSESMVFERVCVKTFAFRVCEWERMWMSVQWV